MQEKRKRAFFEETMGDSSYNFSLTTFNKTGKLLQIEYALNRVLQGKVALGIRGKPLELNTAAHMLRFRLFVCFHYAWLLIC